MYEDSTDFPVARVRLMQMRENRLARCKQKQKQTFMLPPSPPDTQGKKKGRSFGQRGTEPDTLSYKEGEWVSFPWPEGSPGNWVSLQSVTGKNSSTCEWQWGQWQVHGKLRALVLRLPWRQEE